MKSAMRRILPVLFVLTVTAPAAVAQPGATRDQEQLLNLVDRWAAARNANDADAMKPLFAAGMDHIRLSNGEVIGRSAEGTIEWFARSFRGDGKGSTVTVHQRSARVLSADAAVVDFGFTILNQSGAAANDTNVTFFCIKSRGEWRVAALRHAIAQAPAGR